MTDINKLVEQHILEYESRLKHVDEVLERAQRVTDQVREDRELDTGLSELKRDREELSGRIQELKKQPPEHWQKKGLEKAGPMGVWDVVAQRLEELVERIDQKTRSE